jgi:hypothetical protein
MQNDSASRVREDDELIDLTVTRGIMGNISISTAYEDPDLMALKIGMTAPGRRNRMVRFIRREVHALRAQRVARAEAAASTVRAQVEARVELRRAKQRQRTAASTSTP